jgi:hypothetical protein
VASTLSFTLIKLFVPAVARFLQAAVKGKQLPAKEQAAPETLLQAKPLTQKEYLIAIRNRLFLVEEQIWLHEYATSRRSPNIEPLTASAYEDLKLKRQQLLAEYPLTQLQEDLHDAQKRNMTYAAMYLQRLSSSFRRQLPVRLDHVNQIAGKCTTAIPVPTTLRYISFLQLPASFRSAELVWAGDQPHARARRRLAPPAAFLSAPRRHHEAAVPAPSVLPVRKVCGLCRDALSSQCGGVE